MKPVFAHDWVETFIQDARYGVRQIGRSRLHAVAVVLTLALGVGLNTGVFSVLNGMLFRPRVTKDPATFVHLATEVLEKNQTRQPDSRQGDIRHRVSVFID
jgi:hypothetical protein